MPENKKNIRERGALRSTPFDADGKLDLAALEKHFPGCRKPGPTASC